MSASDREKELCACQLWDAALNFHPPFQYYPCMQMKVDKTAAKKPTGSPLSYKTGHFEFILIKVVLQGSPNGPDSHDLSECHHPYGCGRHSGLSKLSQSQKISQD